MKKSIQEHIFKMISLTMLFLSAFLFAGQSAAWVEEGWAAAAENTQNNKPKVLMKTSMGDILLELDYQKAPITVENFLQYVKSGHYNGTIFHRVIPNFMIQGGGMEPGMLKKPTGSPIRNEANNGLKNDVGTLAMARTPVVDSATNQFFINVNNNTNLNYRDSSQRGYGYAVFGKVVKGMEIVRKIEAVPTGIKGGHRDVPLKDVVILSVEIVSP